MQISWHFSKSSRAIDSFALRTIGYIPMYFSLFCHQLLRYYPSERVRAAEICLWMKNSSFYSREQLRDQKESAVKLR